MSKLHNESIVHESVPNNNEVPAISNMDRYRNYRTQFQRLNRAITNQYYLEAIVIEYAIMEDRTSSILSYEGNQIIPQNENAHISITRKIIKIRNLAQQKNSVIARYFAKNLKDKIDLMDEMLDWINYRNPVNNNRICRNSVIHKLMQIITTTEELQDIAEHGKMLCKDLSNRANNYKRMVERHKSK